jgi:hypothetical protein
MTVDVSGERQCLCQPTRTSTEPPELACTTPTLHTIETGDWLKRADQNGRWMTISLGHCIEAPMDAVTSKHVRGPRRTEQCIVACCPPVLISMSCGIVWPNVRLHLDDAASSHRITLTTLENTP